MQGTLNAHGGGGTGHGHRDVGMDKISRYLLRRGRASEGERDGSEDIGWISSIL